MSTTRQLDCSTVAPSLYVALELGLGKWKCAFTVGLGQKPRVRSIEALKMEDLFREIELAKKRFHLAKDAQVHVCYEAGRDGFWIYRFLTTHGIDNVIVDSSSIEVNRRKRRAKTDRLDAEKLVGMLVRYHNGERKVWSVVNVPSIED